MRPGGTNLIVMADPEGNEHPNPGVYLEVIPNEKIVFTNAYTTAWEPSEKPFVTIVLLFEDAGGGKTKYTAVAKHWSVSDKEKHEAMGFHEGWALCADQLEAVAKSL